MEYFIKTNIKEFSDTNNQILIDKLKTLNENDIFYFCQLTYNVYLSKWYIREKCFKTPLKEKNAHGFFVQLQAHIRNKKFNLSKETNFFYEELELFLKKSKNQFYPKTLINDFCNYFGVILSEK